MTWYNRYSNAELVRLASLDKEAGTFSSALLFAVALFLSGFDPADASEVTKTSPQAVSQAAKNPEARERAKLLLNIDKMRGMTNEQKRAYLDSLKGVPQQTSTRAVSVKKSTPKTETSPVRQPAKTEKQPAQPQSKGETVKTPTAEFTNIVQWILKHEGVSGNKTPTLITNPDMRNWTRLLNRKGDPNSGFKIKKDPKSKFIHLENPGDVPKAVVEQFRRYEANPKKYEKLPPNPTLAQAIRVFDQSGATGKIKFLQDHIPGLDVNRPLKDFFVP